MAALEFRWLGILWLVLCPAPGVWGQEPHTEEDPGDATAGIEALKEGRENAKQMVLARIVLGWRDYVATANPDVAKGLDFEVQVEKALDEYFAAGQVVLNSGSELGHGVTFIEHPRVQDFWDSPQWRACLAEHFDPSVAQEIHAGMDRRRKNLLAATANFFEAHLAKSIGITESERETLAPSLEVAAELVVEEGLVISPAYQLQNQTLTLTLGVALEKSKFLEGLSKPRQAIVKRMLRKGRTRLDDLQLEIEYLRLQHDLSQEEVALLNGWAQTDLTRAGKELRPRSNRKDWLPLRSRLDRNRFWRKFLRSVLELDESQELPYLPMRDSGAIEAARADLLFAILDYRAVLSAEQREGLQPLLSKYVDRHERSDRKLQRLFFPKTFLLQRDGELLPKRLMRTGRSASQKAYVETLRETLTPLQRKAIWNE